MKTLLTSAFLLLTVSAFAQDATKTKADSAVYDFGERIYDPRPCSGCPMNKPGEPVSDKHPNARFLNDTTLWEWTEGPYPGTKVYDLKPQYKDTLIRNDGSVIEVPVWLKNPNWIKPEES